LPLYGHELDENTSPIEAGLGWSVKLEKGDFLGCDVMQSRWRASLDKVMVCLKAAGKALPRQGYPVFAGDRQSALSPADRKAFSSATQSPVPMYRRNMPKSALNWQ